jgi:predicted RNase H-like HicB family nuclease
VKREFTIAIEKDDDDYFVEVVTQLKDHHTQAQFLDRLMNRMKEVTKCRARSNLFQVF